MKEAVNTINQVIALSDDELEILAAAADTDSLRTSGKPVPLPQARSKKECDGGYAGNVIPGVPNV